MRQLAIVLFRRLLSSEFDNVQQNVPKEEFEQMKVDLLSLVKLPTSDAALKRKVCDAAAELAKNLIGNVYVIMK